LVSEPGFSMAEQRIENLEKKVGSMEERLTKQMEEM
jgi:hypothetical protein